MGLEALKELIKKIQDTKDEQTFELTEKDISVINELYEENVRPLEVAIINKQFLIASKLIREGGAEITDQAFQDINLIIGRTETFLKYDESLLKNCRNFRAFMQSAKAKDAKGQKKNLSS